MTDKDIEFFTKIENILYSNISFSKKIKSILPCIESYYKANFAVFISRNFAQHNYKILFDQNKERNELLLFLEDANISDTELQGKDILTFSKKEREKKLFFYLLPMGARGGKSGFSIDFLYISFENVLPQEVKTFSLLIRILQNFYRYNRKIVYLRNEYDRIKLLYEISKTIDRLDEVNMKESLLKVMHLVRKSIAFDYFSLYIKEEKGTLKRIDLESSYEIDLLQDFRFHLGIGLSAWVADAREPVIVNDLKAKRRFKISKSEISEKINSIISMPLLFRGETIGVLNLARTFPHKFYKRDLKMLEIVGSQIASILENIRLLEKLENMAYTDGLTGLFNYRYFIKEFEKELKRAERYHYNVSIVMIDIDDFKKVNDVFGHEVGNMVLKKLSDILSEELRSVDILARYGGEEFIILLPNTEKEGAKILSERLREKVKKRFSEIDAEVFPSITITLGISSFPEDGNDVYGLIKKADMALYAGKRQGKNRTIVYRNEIDGE